MLTLDSARRLIYPTRKNAVLQCGSSGGLERRHLALADLLYRRRLQRVQTLMASLSCILWTQRKPLSCGHTKAALLPWQLAAAGEDTGRHLSLKFQKSDSAILALIYLLREIKNL